MKRIVVADAAEPKSIDEIKSYGVTVLPSQKGAGSVLHRIQTVQSQRVSVTKRSTNVIQEYRNYLWMTDKEGKIINEPEHQWSHSMDAGGYATESIYKTENEYVVNDILQAQFSRNISRIKSNSTR